METPTDEVAEPSVTVPVWRFLVSPRWIGWHLTVVLAFWGMLWMGDWQLHRALAGNGLSWAYTFEWPLFAGFAIVFWVKTVRDEFKLQRAALTGADDAESAAPTGPALPAGVGMRQVEEPDDDADDAELAAYNAYMTRLNTEVKGHGKWHGFR